jgi:peptidoglycan/LPS O-acetylase OafA/YrhL
MAVSLHLPVSRRETLRWEFGMALGFATALGATAAMTLFTSAAPWWLLAGGVAAAIVLVSRRLPVGAAAFTGIVGWLCVEGFLLSSDGVLQWHGPLDVLVLCGAMIAALAIPVCRRFMR